MSDWLARQAADDFCYVTTIGRQSGRPRTIEIWFAVEGGIVYLLAQPGRRAHWVRNLEVQPRVAVRLGETTASGLARVVDAPEDRRVRELIAAKYEGWRPGEDLSAWVVEALPVAIEFPSLSGAG